MSIILDVELIVVFKNFCSVFAEKFCSYKSNKGYKLVVEFLLELRKYNLPVLFEKRKRILRQEPPVLLSLFPERWSGVQKSTLCSFHNDTVHIFRHKISSAFTYAGYESFQYTSKLSSFSVFYLEFIEFVVLCENRYSVFLGFMFILIDDPLVIERSSRYQWTQIV